MAVAQADGFYFVDMSQGGRHNEDTKRLIRSRSTLKSHRSGNRKRPSQRKRHSVIVLDVSSPESVNLDPALSLAAVARALTPLRENPTSPETYAPWPVPCQPTYPELLHHLWSIYARGVQGNSDQGRSLRWVQERTMVCPAYFYVNCLSAALDFDLRSSALPKSTVLELKGRTLAALNQAIDTQDDSTRSLLLLTVVRLALHELKGTKDEQASVEQARMHFNAYRLLRAASGDLDELEFPIVIHRYVLWAEDVMCQAFGEDSIIDSAPSSPAAAEVPSVVTVFLPFSKSSTDTAQK